MVAVGDHVGVVHVDVVLAVEQRVDPDAVQEELPHALLFLADRLARLGQLTVAEHRVGEPDHVEDDVQVLGRAPSSECCRRRQRFCEKIVVEIPKLNRYCSCSACIARMVSFALSNPRGTWRTSLCI